MSRVLLLIDHEENRRLLAEALVPRYTVLGGHDIRDLALGYDIIVVDASAAQRLTRELALSKREQAPVFLPVLLISSHIDLGTAGSDLREAVDDVLALPVRKAEMATRIELLLRTRHLSQQVKRHSDDLQVLVHGLTHDLRAPARAATSFAQLLRQECSATLSTTGLHYVHRIEEAATHIQNVLEFLLDFAALGRSQTTSYALPLSDVAAQIVERFAEEIASSGATVKLEGSGLDVLADPVLLDMVISNFVSNALKYTKPNTPPNIVVRTETRGDVARLAVVDQGIGIPADAQEHLWQPFVRLHGEESYPGTGLGLAIARRAAEMMGGTSGLSSEPGRGSCFWLEVPLASGG